MDMVYLSNTQCWVCPNCRQYNCTICSYRVSLNKYKIPSCKTLYKCPSGDEIDYLTYLHLDLNFKTSKK